MALEPTLVSIIVPAYNVEAHLEACIESVLAQTYPTWELILVDDGSKDIAAAICDRYALRDSRIRVAHQPNGGVGAARNTGLDFARGSLIAFLDADDVLPEDSVAARVRLMEGADLCIARYGDFATATATATVPPGESETAPNAGTAGTAGTTAASASDFAAPDTHDVYADERPRPDNASPYLPGTREPGTVLSEMPVPATPELTRREAVLAIIVPGELRYQGFTVNKLFRADIIARNNLRFAEDLAYNEDRLFCTAYALCCKTIRTGPDLVYWYRQAATSAMGSLAALSDGQAARILSEFEGYDRIMDLIRPKYPKFVPFVAGDAMYRAVNLRKAAKSAPQLRRELSLRIVRYGKLALLAPSLQFDRVQHAKMRLHVLLKR